MTITPTPAHPHVPAWKKLGLKLKYAKDDPIPLPEPRPMVASNDGRKRKHTESIFNGSIAAEPNVSTVKAPKKIKKAHSKPSTTLTKQNGNVTPKRAPKLEPAPSPKAPASTSSSPPPTLALTKRKSVSFTPETKATDGQSSKDLYAHWLATQKAEDPAFESPKALPALKSVTSSFPTHSTPRDPTKERKKPEKPKPKIKFKSHQNTPDQAADARQPALTYLTTFTDSPEAWKFKKTHQIYLLKHLFDFSKIPASYTNALVQYLSGLKGLSARQRIRETALKVREEEEMWFSDLLATGNGDGGEKDRKRRREEYEQAWKGEHERLENKEREREEAERMGVTTGGLQMSDWEFRVRKRRRAERLIWMVGEVEVEEIPDNVAADEAGSKAEVNGTAEGKRQANGNATQVGKRKRVRKRRTTSVPDDDSSSSSSSSGSSSDEEEAGARKPAEKSLDSKLALASASSSEEDSDSSIGSSSGSDSDDSG